MSGLLAGKVWLSDLSPRLKPLAATLADIANDDGTSIYPSVQYVAWRLGRSKRFVQGGLSQLRRLGVLEVVANSLGGRGLTVEYRMIEKRLPDRPSWRHRRKNAKPASFSPEGKAQKDAVVIAKGRSSKLERMKRGSPDPSGPANETPNNSTNISGRSDHVAQIVAAAVSNLPVSKAKECVAGIGAEKCLAFLYDLYPQFNKGGIRNAAGLFLNRADRGPEPSPAASDWARRVLDWWGTPGRSERGGLAAEAEVLRELQHLSDRNDANQETVRELRVGRGPEFRR
jgi:hypothetical protein